MISLYNPSPGYAYLGVNASLADALAEASAQINSVLSFATSAECAPWLYSWYCQNVGQANGLVAWQSCPVDGAGRPPTTAAPVRTCRSMCDGYFQACKPWFDRLGPAISSYLPDGYCNDYSDAPQLIDGVAYACWNVTPTLTPVAVNLSCPDYTVKVDGRCRMSCPSAEYTSAQVRQLGLLQQIVAWIAFVTAAVLGGLFLWRAELRQFPTRLILYLLVGAMVLSLAFMLATFVGGDVGDVWCGDVDWFNAEKLNTDDRRINNSGLCAFQAWNIVLGTLLVSFWWAALSFNTALLVRSWLDYVKFASRWRLELVYHVVCWGVPLLCSVIAAAASELAYESSYTFCFIASNDQNAWQIALWFVPAGLCLVFGLLCSLYSFYKLVRQMRDMNRRFVGFTMRILGCVVYFFSIIAIIMTYLVYSTTKEDARANTLVVYFVCINQHQPDDYCRNYAGMNSAAFDVQYGLAAAASFFMASAGFFLALFFGTSRKVRQAVTTKSSELPSLDVGRSQLD